MSKRQYLATLMRYMKADEIKRSAENPSSYMSEIHIKLHYIALRRMGV